MGNFNNRTAGYFIVGKFIYQIKYAQNYRTCIFSEGGFFKAHLYFPIDYPLKPPKMKLISEIWHPNSKFYQLYKIP